MLVVRNIHARQGAGLSLRAISLSVLPGQTLAIVGPNGSGKSTLLRVLAGLLAPRTGDIRWNETVLSAEGRVLVPPGERGMGLLMQEGVLFPHLDVAENVALGLPRAMDQAECSRRVNAVLESVSLSHLRDRSVTVLSGGEQQRVALARALVQHPRVMLLDEPFHSLDGPVKREIAEELLHISKEHSMATVLVTHNTDEAAAFADTVVLMRDGTVAQQGTMDQLYRAPVDAWAASFLGEVARLKVDPLRAWGMELPPTVTSAEIACRPEDISLSVVSTDAGHTQSPPLVVQDVRLLGGAKMVTVSLPDGAALRARVPASSCFQPGQVVRVRICQVLDIPLSGMESRP